MADAFSDALHTETGEKILVHLSFHLKPHLSRVPRRGVATSHHKHVQTTESVDTPSCFVKVDTKEIPHTIYGAHRKPQVLDITHHKMSRNPAAFFLGDTLQSSQFGFSG